MTTTVTCSTDSALSQWSNAVNNYATDSKITVTTDGTEISSYLNWLDYNTVTTPLYTFKDNSVYVQSEYWTSVTGTYTLKFNNTEEKENNTMFNFGAYTKDNIRMSIYGTAVKNKVGKFVAYDKKTKQLMDVDILNFNSSKIFYKIPKALKDVQVGDIVLHNDKIVFVENVREDGKFEVVDPAEGTAVTILPTKSPFGFDYLLTIVNLLDFMPTADADSPFGGLLPFVLAGDDNNGMLAMMMMQNKDTKIDPMIAMLLFNSGGDNLGLYFMLQQMNKKENKKD